MTHTDPTKRHDFVFYFDVTNGNPNGDPDADNQPRVDIETNHGIVTDVAIKRKIRDYAALYREQPIFIQSQVALNSLIVKSFRNVGIQPPQIPLNDEALEEWFVDNAPEGFDVEEGVLSYGGDSKRESDIRASLLENLDEGSENPDLRKKLNALVKRIAIAADKQQTSRGDREKARDRLCQDYYDIRMFGAVLSTGLNAGQVRGPVQLTFARSTDPIHSVTLAITRQAKTTSARMKSGTNEMGRKSIVAYGLYRAHGFVNPHFAEQTGVTADDLELLWEALANMFEFDHAAARGEMNTCGLYVFTHENKLGNAPSRELFSRIDARLNINGGETGVPRSFGDYAPIVVDDQNLPTGVTLTRLVG